jgi:hypothetical protein
MQAPPSRHSVCRSSPAAPHQRHRPAQGLAWGLGGLPAHPTRPPFGTAPPLPPRLLIHLQPAVSSCSNTASFPIQKYPPKATTTSSTTETQQRHRLGAAQRALQAKAHSHRHTAAAAAAHSSMQPGLAPRQQGHRCPAWHHHPTVRASSRSSLMYTEAPMLPQMPAQSSKVKQLTCIHPAP